MLLFSGVVLEGNIDERLENLRLDFDLFLDRVDDSLDGLIFVSDTLLAAYCFVNVIHEGGAVDRVVHDVFNTTEIAFCHFLVLLIGVFLVWLKLK